jgi:predicted aspartyl protease
MAHKIGYLDSAGHPHVKIRVWGVADQFAQEFEAMIDTGFTGFLMLPLVSAFPLALTLFGTTTYTLADGSASPKLLAFGQVDLDGDVVQGLIVLEANASSGPLVGMDFLKRSNKALVVTKTGVWLFDDEQPSVPTPEPSATSEPETAAEDPDSPPASPEPQS